MSSKVGAKLLAVDFEIYGKVQGVFFRKHTQEKGTALGLRGWCMNTEEGTVRGSMEGEADKVEEMKTWLRTKGSPASRIDKAEFKNEKEIQDFNYDGFTVRR
ncbi:UNVERIFIED_CONTAM: hypothetical protein PYX00_010232 [Menopon gallinae]|uniref:Acylphosphatase n=1 Tax=Menopon gallinae TaxID=328185 RepID=A0AAW2HEK8_9NEOP